jgi:hypothetical protein
MLAALAAGVLVAAVPTAKAGTVTVSDKFNAGYSTQSDGDVEYAVGLDPTWLSSGLTVSAYYIGTGPAGAGTYWNAGNSVSNLEDSYANTLTGIGFTNALGGGGTYIGYNAGGGVNSGPGNTNPRIDGLTDTSSGAAGARTYIPNALGSELGGGTGVTDTLTITGLGDDVAYSLWIMGTPYKYNNPTYPPINVSVTGTGAGVADSSISTIAPSGSGADLTFTEGSTYVLFTGFTSATGTVTASSTWGAGSADGLTGFQIAETVVTPEPASLSLLGLAGLALLARRRASAAC